MTMRQDINRAAEHGKSAKATIRVPEPTRCTECGRPAIFMWRRRGFCRAHKAEAQAFTASTPILLPKGNDQ